MAGFELTIGEWIERYGAQSGIRSQEYVRRACRGDVDPRTKQKASLPPGWVGVKRGRQWFLESIQFNISQESDVTVDELLKVTGSYEWGKKRTLMKDFRHTTVAQAVARVVCRENADSQNAACAAVVLFDQLLPIIVGDNELASLIASRWSLQMSVDKPKDIVNPAEQSEKLPKLRYAKTLLGQLKRHYLAAVKQGISPDLTLNFHQNGYWSLNKQSCIDIVDVNPSTPMNPLGERLEDLFYQTWSIQLAWRLSEEKSTGLLRNWLEDKNIVTHPHQHEFLKRCLHCGGKLIKARVNKRFCNKAHEIANKRWIVRLKSADDAELKMKKRAKEICENIVC